MSKAGDLDYSYTASRLLSPLRPELATLPDSVKNMMNYCQEKGYADHALVFEDERSWARDAANRSDTGGEQIPSIGVEPVANPIVIKPSSEWAWPTEKEIEYSVPSEAEKQRVANLLGRPIGGVQPFSVGKVAAVRTTTQETDPKVFDIRFDPLTDECFINGINRGIYNPEAGTFSDRITGAEFGVPVGQADNVRDAFKQAESSAYMIKQTPSAGVPVIDNTFQSKEEANAVISGYMFNPEDEYAHNAALADPAMGPIATSDTIVDRPLEQIAAEKRQNTLAGTSVVDAVNGVSQEALIFVAIAAVIVFSISWS